MTKNQKLPPPPFKIAPNQSTEYTKQVIIAEKLLSALKGYMMNQPINPDILKNSFLFKDASTDILQTVVERCYRMELHAGERLFEQDTPPDRMYFLEEGQIHVVRQYPDGDEVILATEIPFHVIGELSMLANQPRTGSVVAVGDCDLVCIHREDILEFCHHVPDIAIQALNHLSKRLYDLNLRVRESAIGNVTARVASMLLLLVNQETGVTVNPVSKTRIARATAMDVDVVKHLLNEWQEAGIVTINGKQITVNQLDTLRNMAG